MLMDQLLRVKSFHATGYHHRYIKLENFFLGTSKIGNIVYMTDFRVTPPYLRDSP